MSWYKEAKKNLEEELKGLSRTNLDLINGHSKEIRRLMESNTLKPWMADKISTARNDLNDVKMGLIEQHEDY